MRRVFGRLREVEIIVKIQRKKRRRDGDCKFLGCLRTLFAVRRSVDWLNSRKGEQCCQWILSLSIERYDFSTRTRFIEIFGTQFWQENRIKREKTGRYWHDLLY